MTQNPILKVLSVMLGCQVRFLVIGGQACVLYGGSEFSRDTDLVIQAERKNLDSLRKALSELHAVSIAVPELSLENLQRGHAVHFRCNHPDAIDMRIDIMSVLRNAPPFDILWERRTTLELENGISADIVSLPDLIAIKKTQRDKDWSHIRRLIEADYVATTKNPSIDKVRFWLSEARTPEILRELSLRFPEIKRESVSHRRLLRLLPDSDDDILADALLKEEKICREEDRLYWKPLITELEQIRHHRNSKAADR